MDLNEVSIPVTDTGNKHGNGIGSGIPAINPLPQISARTSIGPTQVPIGRVTSTSQSGQNTPIGSVSGHQTPVNYSPRGTMQLSQIAGNLPPVASNDKENSKYNNNTANKQTNNVNTNGEAANRINIEEFTKNMTSRSRDITMKMDTDGDGTISYQEAALFGKHAQKIERKWKCLFGGALFFIFIIFGVIFGLFILGFELTKITDLGGNNCNSLITTSGTQITTVTGEEDVTMDEFWNDDITVDDMVIRWIHGYFNGEYIYITVSNFIKHESPNYLEIFDTRGDIRIDYYLDSTESPNGNKMVLYQTLSNGTVIEKIASTSSGDRRRLFLWWCDGGSSSSGRVGK